MNELALIFELPREWSESTAAILMDRLVKDELPEGLTVKLAYWSQDDMDYIPLRTVLT